MPFLQEINNNKAHNITSILILVMFAAMTSTATSMEVSSNFSDYLNSNKNDKNGVINQPSDELDINFSYEFAENSQAKTIPIPPKTSSISDEKRHKPIAKSEAKKQQKKRNVNIAEGKDKSIQQWLQSIRPMAIKQGVSKEFFDSATNWVTINWNVYDASQRQPEFVQPFRDYISRRVTKKIVTNGRKKLIENIKLLDDIEAKYGVERDVIVAIWAMESRFGSYKGKNNVIRSLATLGYLGWRGSFPVNQLVSALKIAQDNKLDPKTMNGSFAGAMGHTQFIPTTYVAYAVDFDKDGLRDILNNVGDALASTASYLSKSGWKRDRKWGWQVILPTNFDYSLASYSKKGYKSRDDWRKVGIRHVNGAPLKIDDIKTRLLLPIGAKGPAFLISKNFDAILAYNRSNAYAFSVLLISDRFGARGGDDQNWPIDGLATLNVNNRKELQEILNKLGFKVGKVDGIIGTKTRSAVRELQSQIGFIADGHPSIDLLHRARKLIR